MLKRAWPMDSSVTLPPGLLAASHLEQLPQGCFPVGVAKAPRGGLVYPIWFTVARWLRLCIPPT